MNSPKGVKSGVPEIAIISCPACGTRHDLLKKQLETSSTYVTQKYQTCDIIKPHMPYNQSRPLIGWFSNTAYVFVYLKFMKT